MATESALYDVIVIGIGGMGSATAYQLARRGQRVLGLERYNIPHEMGSSHGITRIIRLAYYEHPSYVPLLRRSYELWRELENISGTQVLHITGSIDAAPPGDRVFEGSRSSCEANGLPHEVLTSAEVTKRFPGYSLPKETMAVLQPEGGFLRPENSIITHVQMAQKFGAEIHAREPVISWEPIKDGVRVRTDHATYEAGKLVISAGAWISKFFDGLNGLAVPERQVLAWLQPFKLELFAPERFPVFNLAVEEGRYYGFPIYGVPGFKFGCYHHLQENVDPDQFDRECYARDENMLRAFAARYFPDGAGPTMALRSCMFTNTPDEHFVLDLHPQLSQVCVASPCSGHGFKFCSVVGEIMADLAQHSHTRHDIEMFRLKRLKK